MTLAITPGLDDCGLGHTQADLDALAELVRLAGPVPIVAEIGSFAGVSTHAFCQAGARLVYAVDTWEGSSGSDRTRALCREHDVYGAFRRNLGLDGPNPCPVVPCVGTSAHWSGIADLSPPNLIFIDAEHTEAAVRSDIMLWASRLTPGGVLAGHDYARRAFPGVVRAVDDLVRHRVHWWQWIGILGNTIWAARKR